MSCVYMPRVIQIMRFSSALSSKTWIPCSGKENIQNITQTRYVVCETVLSS